MVNAFIQNVALLIALSTLYQLLVRYYPPTRLLGKVLAGLLFGGVAMAGMTLAFETAPGIIHDGSSIVMTLAGLFGGPTVTLVAVVVAGAYRLLLGGSGVWAGLATIVLCALVGLGFRRTSRRQPGQISPLLLYGIGLTSHVVMLLSQLLLPWSLAPGVIADIWLPVVLIFPVATLLMGLLLQNSQALLKSEERYRSFFETARDAVFITTRDGRWVDCNQAAVEMFGYPSKGELLQSSVVDLYADPEDRRRHTRLIEQHGLLRDEPVTLRRRDGTIIHTLISSAVRKDSEGNVLGYQGTIRDITGQMEMEEALRASEQRFRELADLMPVAVWEVDTEGRFTYGNQQGMRLHGLTARDVLSPPSAFELFVPEDRPRLREDLQRVLSGEELGGVEYTGLRKDGSTFPALIFASAIVREGRPVGVRGITVDITERRQMEEELRQVRDYLAMQIRRMPIGLIIWDTEFRVQSWNPAAEMIFGYSAAEATGKHPYEFIVPDEAQPHVDQIWQRLLSGDETAHSVNSNRRKDGRLIICQWTNTPLKQEDGTITGVLSMVQDITERWQAEGALRESEQRFRALVELGAEAGEAIVLLQDEEGKEGIQVFCNQTWPRLTGYSEEELLGTSFFDLLHPDDHAASLERHRRKMHGESLPGLFEVTLLRKDGSEVPVELTGAVTTYRGRAANVVYLRDISARKAAEQRLGRLNRALRVLRDVNQLITHEKDRQALQQGICDLLAETPGYQHAWLVELDTAGTPGRLFSAGETAGSERLQQYLQNGQLPVCIREAIRVESPPVLTGLDPARHHDCPLAPFHRHRQVAVARLAHGERLYGALGVVTSQETPIDSEEVGLIAELAGDVAFALSALEAEAEAREAAALRRFTQLQTTFLANVSHELRTPLASIKGFISTLLRPDVQWSEPERREFLQIADREADRLGRLVSDLLDMSRIEVGTLRLDKRHCTLNEVRKTVAATLEQLTARHHLKWSVPRQLPAMLADPQRVGQVITNLVENAAKFSEEGTEIQISAVHQRGMVAISVADQGQGIPPEQLERIFDRFYQLEHRARGQVGGSGTGLGLSICRGIVEAHGGKIWAESQPGEGARFTFTLPLYRPESPAPGTPGGAGAEK